jgi:hypothetical protein
MAIVNGELVQAIGELEVWFIEDNHRRWIPDPTTLVATWNWTDVRRLSLAEVYAVPRGANLPSALQIVQGNYGWAVLNSPRAIPGWFGAENQGAGVAIADINGSGRPDLVVFHIDNPGGENAGYYRIGWDLNAGGTPQQGQQGWTNPIPVPGWFGAENQGAGVAIADINGSGRPDLVVFHIDNPGGENVGYYRIGWDLDNQGITSSWSNPIQIPGWFGAENQGGDIALIDINRSGRLDLVVAHIDNPGGDNRGYYRIGWDLNNNGQPTGWSKIKPIPGWFGWENQGLGIAAFRHFGEPSLVVAHVDNPAGANWAWVRVTGLDVRGNTVAGWSSPNPLRIASGSTAGAGVTTGFLTGRTRPDLVMCYIEDFAGENTGYSVVAEVLVGVP